MYARNLKFDDALTGLPKSPDARPGEDHPRFTNASCGMAQPYMTYVIVGVRSPVDLVGRIVVSNWGAMVTEMGVNDN